MPTFKDSQGQAWEIPEFTVGLIRAIKNRTGFDFNAMGDKGEKLFGLRYDGFIVCDVVAFIANAQREKLGISEEEFAQRCNRTTIDAAWDALVEAYTDFSRGPEAAKVIREVSLRPVKAKMDCAIVEALRNSVTDSPASSG